MSGWDNVSSVYAVALYAGDKQTSATLFVNGLHQIPITVALSFNLVNNSIPGPTDQEIQDALVWVDYQTGNAPDKLAPSPVNEYCLYYSNQTTSRLAKASKMYQNSVDFDAQILEHLHGLQNDQRRFRSYSRNRIA